MNDINATINNNVMIIEISRLNEKRGMKKKSLLSKNVTIGLDKYAITKPIMMGEIISIKSLKKL